MEYLRNFARSHRQRQIESAYEPISNTSSHLEKSLPETCSCDHCGHQSQVRSSVQSTRLRIALHLAISLVLLALWTVLVSCFLARNPHLLHWYSGSKNMIEQFPIVPLDFQPNTRFTDSDPFDSPFWRPDLVTSDSVDHNAWNYYGNAWIWLKKGSRYEVPGGRELRPLYEKDAWMKDYVAYQTAYQHDMHCVGIIKHVLNAYRDGKNVTAEENEHANKHCLEVIRHSIMCHPDFTIQVPSYNAQGEEHEPYWGGAKHMCRDQSKVHDFLASRNMGFKMVWEGGVQVMKAWVWALPMGGEW